MPVCVTLLLPVELAALYRAVIFFSYIAVRDKSVDGIRDGRRMAPVIGMAGSTGITKNCRLMTDLKGRRMAPLSIFEIARQSQSVFPVDQFAMVIFKSGLCSPGPLIMSLLLGKTARQDP